jgi:type VI secretion system protein ImpC
MANDAQQKESQVSGGGLAELDEFSDILKQTIKPRTDEAAKEVNNAVVALVREAMADDSEMM